VLLCDTEREVYPRDETQAVALLFNTAGAPIAMHLPRIAAVGEWHAVLSTSADVLLGPAPDGIELPGHSLACLVFVEALPASLMQR
jgi:hypothetical protein